MFLGMNWGLWRGRLKKFFRRGCLGFVESKKGKKEGREGFILNF